MAGYPPTQQYPQQGYGAGAPPPAGRFNGYEQKPGGPPGYPPQGAAYGYPPQAAYGVPQYPPQAAYPPQQQQYGYQQQAAAPGYGARPPQDPEAAMGAGYAAPDAAMASAMAFAETRVRNAFVRKVFGILAIQLAITVGFACVCIYVNPVKNYVRTNRWPFWTAWGLSFGLLLVITCVEKARRTYPLNMILLAAFTVVEAFLVGMISAYWNIEVVMLAFLVTCVAVFGLSLFAVNTKVDATKWGSMLLVAGLAFLVLILVGIFWISRIYYLVIAGVACLLFSAYLIYDIQMLMGGRRYSTSPDEYVFAALSIYLDIINIFLALLSIIGFASSN